MMINVAIACEVKVASEMDRSPRMVHPANYANYIDQGWGDRRVLRAACKSWALSYRIGPKPAGQMGKPAEQIYLFKSVFHVWVALVKLDDGKNIYLFFPRN